MMSEKPFVTAERRKSPRKLVNCVSLEQEKSTADIGPGHYDIHRYNDQYGPTHSNLLKMSVVDSGRGEDEFKNLTPAMRRYRRNMALLEAANPKKEVKIVEESGMLGAESSLGGVNVDLGKGTKRFVTREEPYVKTQGGKLPVDFDPHLDRHASLFPSARALSS